MLNKGADSGLHWRADRVIRHGYFHARGCPHIDTMIGKTFIPSLDLLQFLLYGFFAVLSPPKAPELIVSRRKNRTFFEFLAGE